MEGRPRCLHLSISGLPCSWWASKGLKESNPSIYQSTNQHVEEPCRTSPLFYTHATSLSGKWGKDSRVWKRHTAEHRAIIE